MYGIYNAETIEKLVNTLDKCTIKLYGMKGYLHIKLLIGLIGIYQKEEWCIML